MRAPRRRDTPPLRRLKVMTVVGTRPEIIKLSRVISELDSRTQHVLVHTGQNFDYELNEIFFRQLKIRPPDHYLGVAERNAARTIGMVIVKADEVLEQERPEALLIYGDTNSCLAALAAKRRRIPIFHMEAGNRCFDQRVPEEINRKLIDHLSDVNLTITEHARRYLLAEGVRPDTVIKVGSSMREVLAHYREGIERSDVVERLGLSRGGYFLVSAHREENVDEEGRLHALLSALAALGRRHRLRIVMSTHPRTRKRMAALAPRLQSGISGKIEFLDPFGFFEWVQLESHAFCVLSDSGTLTEEAALLGFPAVMIRDAHERPEGMDAGVAVMSGLATERVLQAVELATAQRLDAPETLQVPDYAESHVARKVVRIILSYVDYVRRTTWSEPPR